MPKKTLKNNARTGGNGGRRAAAIGAGALAAAALAIAGSYVLWENMGKQKQAKVKAWVAKARKEAAKNIMEAKKKISQTDYQRIIDAAVKRYGTPNGISKEELMKVAQDLKADWKHVQGHAKAVAQQLKKQHAAMPGKGTTAKKSKVPRSGKRRVTR